jgi:mRNA interferase RelE/StbE
MSNLIYSVRLSNTTLKKLKSFSLITRKRILNKIEHLQREPMKMQNVKKLVKFDIAYSMRVGDYRILFDRDDEIRIIDIIDIRQRKESYRRK